MNNLSLAERIAESERRKAYARDNVAKGLCAKCTEPLAAYSNCLCEHHVAANRVSCRNRRHGQTWRPGARGRIPLEVKMKISDDILD